MAYDRRSFLKQTAGLTTGMALLGSNLQASEFMNEKKKIGPFGLQLWSVRDDLAKDARATLKSVAAAGYKQIESFEGAQGMFWGMSAAEFKKFMGGLGMTIISSHCDINKDFERKAADAASIGMKYLVCPWVGPQKSTDDYKKLADSFNEKGKICKKNGIRFAYHNHAYSFQAIDGVFPQDVMMKNTDASLVDFEMDIYWVVTGGQDPEAWFKKYPNRFRACHVKDRIKGATEEDASCVLGQGSINFPKILKTAQLKGMKYFIVEHERWDNTTPLQAAADDAAYMKKLMI